MKRQKFKKTDDETVLKIDNELMHLGCLSSVRSKKWNYENIK